MGWNRERERVRLTPAEERLLGLFAMCFLDEVSMQHTKQEMADYLGCCVKTIDRSVRTLRDAGYIEVIPRYKKSGGSCGNEYRLRLPED